jgi:hypothetical protein
MRIVFARRADGGSLATIHRDDGVVVSLPSFSRKHAVPHDLAHAVAERRLGMPDGVFGSIASGAMFSNMRLVSGRPGHDAAARSARVLTANKRSLTVAELMAGVVHDAVEHPGGRHPGRAARHDWGIVREEPFPWTDADVAAAVDELREQGRRWANLRPSGTLELSWPATAGRRRRW